MPRLALALVLASWLWPAALASAGWSAAQGSAGWGTTVVYAAASLVCHQRPDRSFATAGVPWPVCGRCTGLYLGAPLGALLAWRWRRSRGGSRRLLWSLVAGTAPTVASLAVEATGLAPVGNAVRCALAVPAGAVLAFAVVRTAADASGSIG